MEALKLALIAAGLLQYELAARVGMTETRLSRIFRGRIAATSDEQKALAKALKTTARSLFGSTTHTRRARAGK